jgi:cell wall-associated NlpC family hydrolase
MTREQVVAKAMSAVGTGTEYSLFEGTPGKACSCSRFIAWVLGVPVKIDLPLYRRWNGGWFETTAVYRDAKSPYGFFREVPWELAEPADLVVWPDTVKGQGHMGLVVQAKAGLGPAEVVHCSRGNWKRTGDAIRVTDPKVFVLNRAVVARWHDFDGEDDIT